MLYIGTSGFSYSAWKDVFYPQKMASSKWLTYYASRFNTLELNNTFYRFPIEKNLIKQAEMVPDNFKFTVKAHKIITHTRRMKNAKEKVDEFMDIVHTGLGDKLGCVLFQLPPSLAFNEEIFEAIVEAVPHESRYVVEFRHQSWWDEKIWNRLKKYQITFCNVSFPKLPETPTVKYGPTFYQRMHGIPKLFQSSYSDAQLKKLASKVPTDKDCYVYFNNTMFEAGFRNAETLKSLLS